MLWINNKNNSQPLFYNFSFVNILWFLSRNTIFSNNLSLKFLFQNVLGVKAAVMSEAALTFTPNLLQKWQPIYLTPTKCKGRMAAALLR
jgi:hypothetical protein